MKKISLTFFILVSFFWGFLPAAQCEDKILIGEVKYVVGEVKASENDLKVGSKVYNNDLVITENASMVRLLRRDGVAMQIGANTTLRLIKEEKKILRVSLHTGSILSRLRKLAEKAATPRYEVRTKHAALGVRGTTFFVKVEKGENTFLCLCEGDVDVIRGGTSLELTAKNHDAVKTISTIGMDDAPNMGKDHSDKDLAALDRLLN